MSIPPLKEPLWIWSEDHAPAGETNAWFRFERTVGLPPKSWGGTGGGEPVIEISADSRYRLWINGKHVADGPARGWADAPFFDRIEVGGFLRADGGDDVFIVEVTHLGVDTFQYQRGWPGLWLRLLDAAGGVPLVSDESWRVRRIAGRRANVPRISPQLGFEEHFDATMQEGLARRAIRQCKRTAPPQPSGVPALRSERREGARIVARETIQAHPPGQAWTIHARTHLGPFPHGINLHGMAGVFAAEFWAEGACALELAVIGLAREVCLDGVPLAVAAMDQDLRLYRACVAAGAHGISLSVCDRYDHVPELSVAWRVAGEESGGTPVRWRSPLGGRPGTNGRTDVSPWVSTGPLWRCEKDSHCPVRVDGSVDPEVDTFERSLPELARRVDALARHLSMAGFARNNGTTPAAPLPAIHLAEADAYLAVRLDRRRPGPPSSAGQSLRPGERLILEFGDIVNGFFEMDIEAGGQAAAAGGAIIDAYFFEHYEPGDEATGAGPRIQHMQNEGSPYRTSFRYAASAGRQSFLSAQRRGFRYAMLTLRGEGRRDIRLHSVAVVESLYPADPVRTATFSSSDARLDAIFRISQRTLHLCMEDTFTDCPSYEQTFWVGDARHEALFACVTFGAYDLAERCARLVADSHRHMRMPMAACQCPSGWDAVLPSFSFLWVISVAEIHLHTGNDAFLREVFPAVRRTLDTSLRLCTHHGLFSAPTWNFLEWAPIDQGHDTVLHNSLLLAGALGAAIRMAEILDDEAAVGRDYAEARSRLIIAIGRLWREDAGAFADALVAPSGIRLAGEPSPRTSQHTSFFALLFDVLPTAALRAAALRNCLTPPAGMTTVGSPFAMFLLLEALLREGHSVRVLEEMRTFWGRILDAGSTTCWEMVHPPSAPFPTRSYCHGWSAGPVYLLPFLFFGIEILEPGWKAIRLTPRLLDLRSVEATVCTPLGMLTLRQGLDEAGKPVFNFAAPQGMRVQVNTEELDARPSSAPDGEEALSLPARAVV